MPKKCRVEITRAAERDILGIYDYIERDSRQRAVKWFHEIERRFGLFPWALLCRSVSWGLRNPESIAPRIGLRAPAATPGEAAGFEWRNMMKTWGFWAFWVFVVMCIHLAKKDRDEAAKKPLFDPVPGIDFDAMSREARKELQEKWQRQREHREDLEWALDEEQNDRREDYKWALDELDRRERRRNP